MADLKMGVPEEMMRKKRMELEIEKLEMEKARVTADTSMPDWKKKMANNSLNFQIRQYKLQDKQSEMAEMQEGM